MSEKKVVSRRMFIAFEIVCIILIVCLVGATSLYSWQISDKDKTISSLNSQVAAKNSTISSLNSQVSDLWDNLTSAIQKFTLESFSRSTVWINNQTIVQQAGQDSNWVFSATSVGFVLVTITATNETFLPYPALYIEVDYFAYGAEHSFHQGLDYTSGTGFFPILPSSNISVTIGNLDNYNSQTYTMTITYYY